ncbi:MAG TPA: hypothetical protein VGO89_15155 [Streptomyces sp.]|jgi:hypothetical protein|nr:hypothetical protein [Streptomyces sp.]
MSDDDNDSPRRADSRYTTGIVIGMALGSVLGLLVFDNIALGFGMGLPLGLVIGMTGQPRRGRGESRADDN